MSIVWGICEIGLGKTKVVSVHLSFDEVKEKLLKPSVCRSKELTRLVPVPILFNDLSASNKLNLVQSFEYIWGIFNSPDDEDHTQHFNKYFLYRPSSFVQIVDTNPWDGVMWTKTLTAIDTKNLGLDDMRYLELSQSN